MRRLGCDFSRPRIIDTYLYFPAHQDAELAGAQLRAMGFHVEIEHSAVGTDWLCLASKSMMPEQETLSRLRVSLTELAYVFRGAYDGWETQVGDDEENAD